MVGCNEIATRVSYYRHIQFFESLDYILSKAILVGECIARIIDTTVDASTHMPERS